MSSPAGISDITLPTVLFSFEPPVSGSRGFDWASKLTVRRTLASFATATFARSKSLHTCAAMKPTNNPKMMPSGGRIPGESALKVLARSSTARGEKISADKDNNRHLHHRKVEQPVAHRQFPVRSRKLRA